MKIRTRARRARRGQHERRLRQVELQRERLHRRVVEAARVLEHAQRIAGERGLGEHVDEAERVVGHRRASGAAVGGRTPRVEVARQRAEVGVADAGGNRDHGVGDAREVARRSSARTWDRSGCTRSSRDQRVPVARARGGGPALDGPVPVQRDEVREARGERRRVGEEVRVLVLQQLDAQRLRRVDADARRRRASRRAARRAPARVPILLALGLDVDRARRIEALRAPSSTWLSKRFCDGCGSPGRSPSSEPRCRASAFEVEHLRADRCERVRAAGSCPSR